MWLWEEGWDGNSIHAVAVFGTIFSPFWVPRLLMEDHDWSPCAFASYPYHRFPGYLVTRGSEELPSQSWSLRLGGDLSSSEEDLDVEGFALLWEHSSRIGVDAALSRWEGDLPSGTGDELRTGDLNVLLRFSQSERAAFRAGIGWIWLDDEGRRDDGPNMTYGLDLFPIWPLVLSGELDLGILEQGPIWHARATLGAVLSRVELYAGVDALEVDRDDSATLVFGSRLWL